MAAMINMLVILLEMRGLYISISDRKWKIFAYYTQLSNLTTVISCILYVLFPHHPLVWSLRYLSSCMLTMTFLITLFVLVPMGGGFRRLMLEGNGLYHHTLCPLLSVFSYIWLEEKGGSWLVPACVTLVYGLVMMELNRQEKFIGPYPFFRVNQQSKTATVLWTAALFALISVISLIIPA